MNIKKTTLGEISNKNKKYTFGFLILQKKENFAFDKLNIFTYRVK